MRSAFKTGGEIINKLILFLSKYKKAEQNKPPYRKKLDFWASKPKSAVPAVDLYASDLNLEIAGSNTNDAPVKYFIEYLACPQTSECKPAVLDEILCLISQESYQQGDHNLFAAMVHDYCCEKHLELYGDKTAAAAQPIISIIPYGFTLEEPTAAITDSQASSARICQDISEHVAPEDQVFIDFTGGFRDVSFLLVLLIRYLEYLGIRCGKVVYSNFNSRPKRIVDISYMYEAFQLINGASEFTSFGNSRALSRYWEGKLPPEHPVNSLLAAMKRFGESMSLCLVVDNQINDILAAMNQSIAAIRSRSAAEPDFEAVMLRLILDEIARKFHLQNNEQLETIHLIRWCLENDLIQQAITLYIEHLPELYFTRGWLAFKSAAPQQLPQNNYAKEFYEVLFNDFGAVAGIDAKNIPALNQFIEVLNKLKDNIRQINYVLRNCKYQQKDQKINKLVDKYCNDNLMPVRNAAFHLLDYLWLRYVGDDSVHNKSDQIIPGCFRESLNSSNIAGCFNAVMNNKKLQIGLVQGFQLETEKESKTETSEYQKRDEAQKLSNEKKLSALHMLEQITNDAAFELDWCRISKADLLTLFRDYHFIKVIRNQINHANVVELEPEIVAYYCPLGYNFELTVKNIRSNLQAALNRVQAMEEKYSQLPSGR